MTKPLVSSKAANVLAAAGMLGGSMLDSISYKMGRSGINLRITAFIGGGGNSQVVAMFLNKSDGILT